MIKKWIQKIIKIQIQTRYKNMTYIINIKTYRLIISNNKIK